MASWLFPPHASIGAKRAYRFARWLPSHGWHPTVLCRRRAPASSHDPSPWPLPPAVTVRAEYDAAVFARFTPPPSEAAASPSHAPTAKGLTRAWRDRLDERWGLLVDAVVPCETVAVHAPHAAARLDALAPAHDLLWTTSYPYHTHWLGVRAAKKHRKPLVVDLRDPWTPNWVHRRKLPHARAVEAWMEREVFEAADAIVVTTWALEALYRKMFPRIAHKFMTLHNAFDAAPDAPGRAVGEGGVVRLVHFGNVYGPWSFETLFRALAALRRDGSLAGRTVVLENYGKLSDRDRATAIALGVDDLVRVLPGVPFAEGMERLRSADLLMLAAWSDPDARLYVQGKLFDYLAAGRPVVAETAHEDVTRILAETGAGFVVAPGDVGAMTDLVRRALAPGGLRTDATDATRAPFSAPEATRRLAALFDRLVTT
jgi:glycosyltransferase involved in cell wall biosynthesis